MLNGTSRYEQLLQLHAQNPLPYLLDLHAPILQAKSRDHFLFYKNDTHWNERGAYIAYKEIAKSLQTLFPGVELTMEYTFNEDQVVQCKEFSGLCDLAVMALTQGESVETLPVLEPSAITCARPVEVSRYADPAMLTKNDQSPFASACPQKKAQGGSLL